MGKIIHGDSLIVLDTLDADTVQAVYIDPPFNSGRNYTMSPDNNKGFSDIWNSDEEYSEFLENMVLKSKRLLRKNGSLFLHISADEMFIPSVILNKNFKHVKPIFWKKSRSKNNTKNKLGTSVDIIFWCFDDKNKKFNMVYQALDSKYLNTSYNNKDSRGKYALGHLVSDPTRVGSHIYEIKIGERVFSPERGWRISKSELEILLKDERIHVPKSKNANLYKKIYLHESKGKPCLDLWDDIHSLAQGSEKRLYPTAKPIKLLERIIEMTTDPGDIVLDPVAGSGTTGCASKNLKRDYILIDRNIDSVNIMKSRLGE